MNQWDDIYEIPLPLPFALKIVKVYLVKGSDGYTLVDTGLHDDEALAAWEEAKRRIGFQWSDIKKIILTHYHPDHYGLAGWIQDRSGAPVFLSETDFAQAQLFFAKNSKQPEAMGHFYRKHGLVEEWAKQIPPHLRGYQSWVEPHPEPTFISAGESILIGDRSMSIYHTPGHADGHLSFYDPKEGDLLGGDFLLPRITPNISLWPGCDPNPLRTFLQTLDKMRALPVQRIFPAHGRVFDTYQQRIEELEHHHEERLAQMEHWVKESPISAAQVCFKIFGTKLSIHNLRFALSETLAHLEYLTQEERIERQETDAQWWYTG